MFLFWKLLSEGLKMFKSMQNISNRIKLNISVYTEYFLFNQKTFKVSI